MLFEEERDNYGDINHVVQELIAAAIAEKNTKYQVMLRDNAIEAAIAEQNGIPIAISR